jgi:Icc-related predicted phosphoesterase
MRIAAVADIHFGASGKYPVPDFALLAEDANVLLVCGDLTDRGLPEEAQGLMKDLVRVKIPVVAVLGNHDFEAGQQQEVQRILAEGGIHVLDGDACEIDGVGFAGTKGFAGGFGRATLEPWGEPAVKAFVQAAVDETLKLESALARLRTPQIVAVLHYAPIQGTVEGEPTELFPFLGCSRLEEPLNRYSVAAVFHGHAHRGAAEGRTMGGAPVFNVSLPILRSEMPDGLPVRRWELSVNEQGPDIK